MSEVGRSIFRRARTAAALPGRVVEVENRADALEIRVADQLEGMRSELAEIRTILDHQIESDIDATDLLGRLLRSVERRLEDLEGEVSRPERDAPSGSDAALGRQQGPA